MKFDPSDQEIILHLLAKAGLGDSKPHPFIDEFIPTVDKDDGICYTHPEKLPGRLEVNPKRSLLDSSLKFLVCYNLRL